MIFIIRLLCVLILTVSVTDIKNKKLGKKKIYNAV